MRRGHRVYHITVLFSRQNEPGQCELFRSGVVTPGWMHFARPTNFESWAAWPHGIYLHVRHTPLIFEVVFLGWVLAVKE